MIATIDDPGGICGAAARAADDIVVILNKDNAHTVDRTFVMHVYTGVSKAWPDGSPVFPLDQDQGGDVRDAFCQEWLGRSQAAVSAIWAQNIFTGKALPPKAHSSIPAGERLRVSMPGGGGYGDPHRRPAAKVAEDVMLGLVSVEAARELYGVALSADATVDEAETARLRTKVAAE